MAQEPRGKGEARSRAGGQGGNGSDSEERQGSCGWCSGREKFQEVVERSQVSVGEERTDERRRRGNNEIKLEVEEVGWQVPQHDAQGQKAKPRGPHLIKCVELLKCRQRRLSRLLPSS